jgi:hypothetical protein
MTGSLTREMLDAAHASAWHWTKVGTQLNRMRAVHAVHAHAASAAGETEKHRISYGLAVAALEAISSEVERGMVASTFSHVPKP